MTSPVLNKPKGLMSVATKVALQMNCKLGGEPWAVKIPMKVIFVFLLLVNGKVYVIL